MASTPVAVAYGEAAKAGTDKEGLLATGKEKKEATQVIWGPIE